MMSDIFTLTPGTLTLNELRVFWLKPVKIKLDDTARERIQAARDLVEQRIADGVVDYGISTGFGLLASTHIPPDKVEQLQENLVLSHMAGTGEPLEDSVVRLIMVLKASSLGQGYSGIRQEIIDALLALVSHEVYPIIPSKGSVGASGDLAPLAHMTSALMGVGTVRHLGGEIPAIEGLKIAGLKPFRLKAKEGLALLNGTQVSTALALKGLFKIENVFAAAMVAGGLSIDALMGTDAAFDKRIHRVRRQLGQRQVAAKLRKLLLGSEIRSSHADCERVQDPYSLRCQPQVMGAALDVIQSAADTLHDEADAVTDNPLIFIEEDEVLSGGNFHAEPVAFAADMLALAIAEVGSISERRTALMVDPSMSELPAFLVADSGLNSGFMIAQVTAAAMVAENRQRAAPTVVDSVPTSANQEDHVSMATYGARRLSDMADNAATIIAVELLCACQGIDFREPLKTSLELGKAYDHVRSVAKHWQHDRIMATDMEVVKQQILGGDYLSYADDLLPSGSEET